MSSMREEALEKIMDKHSAESVIDTLVDCGIHAGYQMVVEGEHYDFTVFRFGAIEVLRAHVARLQEKAKVADFREIFDRNRERIYAENPTPHSTRVGEIKGSVIVPDTED